MVARASWVRLVCAVVGGVVVGVVLASGDLRLAFVGGWIATAAIFLVWTWAAVGRMDADATRSHAIAEDPSRVASSIVLVVASVASLLGVGLLLAAGSRRQDAVPVEAAVGVASVFGSWLVVHTVFALHYARLYYQAERGRPIDFNSDDDPDYQDFAYLAFTLGMTYQVSDTALNSREIRHTALRHGLLSFVLGAVVIACTINLVVQVASVPMP